MLRQTHDWACLQKKGKHIVKISSKLVNNCNQERVLKISNSTGTGQVPNYTGTGQVPFAMILRQNISQISLRKSFVLSYLSVQDRSYFVRAYIKRVIKSVKPDELMNSNVDLSGGK